MARNSYHEATLRRLLREAPVTAERAKKAFGSMSMGQWLTVAVLLGLLALAAVLALGVGLSLLVGFGLMALLLYSSRMGYDEPVRALDKQQAGD